MPRFTTDAIILHCIDFAESDKIVCALTRDKGVIHAIAKGAKRSKKRFPGTLEPFCEVTLDLFSRRGGICSVSNLHRSKTQTLPSGKTWISSPMQACLSNS